jgi:hypothetical protein
VNGTLTAKTTSSRHLLDIKMEYVDYGAVSGQCRTLI